MSRSNPTQGTPNPAGRWLEWHGATGTLRYWDKELEVPGSEKRGGNVEVQLPFRFVWLDELSTVRGWHERSKSGIFANEVRDTRKDAMLVKAFKGGVIANGFWADIRAHVKDAGGHFVSNNYVVFKDGQGGLALAGLQFKGKALNAWIDFRGENRDAVQKKAVAITDKAFGKNGSVEFYTPVFAVADLSEAADEAAKKVDAEVLQPYLDGYLKRKATEQAKPAPAEPEDDGRQPDPEPNDPYQGDPPPVDDDVPF